MSMIVSMPDGGGLDTLTVTCGVAGVNPNRAWGYDSRIFLGSISPTTSRIYGGVSVIAFFKQEQDGVYLIIAGIQPNSGWTQVSIGGQLFSRASATYSNPSSNSQWYWPLTGLAVPFANSGQKVCVFS